MGLKNTQNHETKALTSNQQSTLQIPTNGKIQSLMLFFADSSGDPATEAEIRAEIGNIRLTFNGRDVVNASTVELLDLYEFLGSAVFNASGAPAGAMELNIGRLVYASPEARDLMGLGTADIANIQVQVSAGTLSNIASVQGITSRTPVNENLGAHCEYISYPQSFNATGDHTVDTLPRNTDSSYLGLVINDGASGVISHSEVRVNNYTIRERLALAVNNLLLSENKYTQPAGHFIHGFVDGSIDGRLPMVGVTDLRCITTFSTAPGTGGYTIGALTLITPAKSVN